MSERPDFTIRGRIESEGDHASPVAVCNVCGEELDLDQPVSLGAHWAPPSLPLSVLLRLAAQHLDAEHPDLLVAVNPDADIAGRDVQ